MQPDRLEDGLQGDTNAAVESIDGQTASLVETIHGVTDEVESLGTFGNEINVVDILLDLLKGESEHPLAIIANFGSDIVTAIASIGFKVTGSIAGLLSIQLIKRAHADIASAAIEGREVQFDYV